MQYQREKHMSRCRPKGQWFLYPEKATGRGLRFRPPRLARAISTRGDRENVAMAEHTSIEQPDSRRIDWSSLWHRTLGRGAPCSVGFCLSEKAIRRHRPASAHANPFRVPLNVVNAAAPLS